MVLEFPNVENPAKNVYSNFRRQNMVPDCKKNLETAQKFFFFEFSNFELIMNDINVNLVGWDFLGILLVSFCNYQMLKQIDFLQKPKLVSPYCIPSNCLHSSTYAYDDFSFISNQLKV